MSAGRSSEGPGDQRPPFSGTFSTASAVFLGPSPQSARVSPQLGVSVSGSQTKRVSTRSYPEKAGSARLALWIGPLTGKTASRFVAGAGTWGLLSYSVSFRGLGRGKDRVVIVLILEHRMGAMIHRL